MMDQFKIYFPKIELKNGHSGKGGKSYSEMNSLHGFSPVHFELPDELY